MAVITTFTQREIVEQAQRMSKALTDEYDTKGVLKNAEELYERGNKLVTLAVANRKQIFQDVTSPVVVALSEVVSLENIQNETELHRVLCKAYRTFVEFTWYQFWNKGSLPVLTKTINTIIESSDDVISVLPKEEVYVEFEYKCAKEAAKFLEPAESVWKKYLNHTFDIICSAADQSYGSILSTFKNFLVDAQKDWIKTWYPDVWEVRWQATQIRTFEDLNKIIPLELITKFKGKGGKYTLCLATVWDSLIKNSQVEQKAKDTALKDLCSLLIEQDQGRFQRLVNKVSKITDSNTAEKIAIKSDRYWKTHVLTLQFLVEYLGKGTSNQFMSLENRKYIRATVKTFASQIQHRAEKALVLQQLEELSRTNKKNVVFIKNTKQYLQNTFEGIDEEKKQLKKQYEEKLKEVEIKQAEVAKSLAETSLQTIDNEKDTYVQELLKAIEE